ncbi:hypothetical protein A3J19_01830 [Candidatus Daviesbacteria bacterium RIFCSPLOWO2_02_FULL_41_8]|uniref:ABC transporter domain-containing protein n=3 Tax=Candidatus Daviesiibacteriota TaxID=1752718 RepID=A0A1F5NHU6_9BACT|nr:MAG: hypothetical protein A2871_00915 [Candidatus Daviesbacteria bacterium RIFCSPHIGHO2_01_FULL_41_23]OGE32965.1 MAG: hypothetical protein A3D83_04850 [Candidatus Daviesbacteria bacterium RIFCSPHIGHO2_02_FULL_41_10]OGE62455.1 MAG: hypothetical protein A2967_01400 [Candidatus Daviesbacteria bacterium RIFCSPLOWO2_01_FULL_41_32]OGE77198.1 MAG: hypothetical protein A3J19_01830 [Candidatus Daviesbacteria bacterium RIFCSPLOWO2_02_FULL_41_8]
MKPIISVKNLSKKFQIREKLPYYSLRDSLTNLVKGFSKPSGRDSDSFWALKNVSFDVYPGEVLGIIGRNGAGKSTLLKILSQITPPTSGTATLEGRVASLLEVGTGFHPELTGRENIYLNGAILGMSRNEIKGKFDEIVDFAEIEKFLDTPVKHYSSGMYMRLAFAVAAHLEPEILLVDEVLAVGDTQFQKKCLGKMADVNKKGKTIILVSHNLDAIESMSSETLLLDTGKVKYLGKPNQAINTYQSIMETKNKDQGIIKISTNQLKWMGISNNKELLALLPNNDITFKFQLKSRMQRLGNIYIDCALFNERGENIVHTKSKFLGNGLSIEKNKRFQIVYKIESPKLAPGIYYITVYIYNQDQVLFWIENLRACRIINKTYFGNTYYFEDVKSCIVPKFSVQLEN